MPKKAKMTANPNLVSFNNQDDFSGSNGTSLMPSTKNNNKGLIVLDQNS